MIAETIYNVYRKQNHHSRLAMVDWDSNETFKMHSPYSLDSDLRLDASNVRKLRHLANSEQKRHVEVPSQQLISGIHEQVKKKEQQKAGRDSGIFIQ